MRIFSAFQISPEVTAEAKRIQNELRKNWPGTQLRFTAPEAQHVTLNFFGEVNAGELEKIIEATRLVAHEIQAFNFELQDIIGLPPSNQARSIVIGLHEIDTNYSIRLYDAVRQKLNTQNVLTPDRPWTPHLTLARVKGSESFAIPPHAVAVKKIIWPVTSVDIIESKLTANGPEHTTLTTIPFNQ